MIFLVSCSPLQPRYLTEYYVKNYIENHDDHTFSEVKMVLLYKGSTISGNRYLEVSAFKYKNEKGLVFGGDIINPDKNRIDAHYYSLKEEDVLKMKKGYEASIQNMDTPRVGIGEITYSDYSINKDFYVSIKDSDGKAIGEIVNIWMYQEKYSIQASVFNRILKKFIEY